MNTETALQSHLDENPDDHTGRMVLADYLQEHGDPRAEGYRALGTNKKHAISTIVGENTPHHQFTKQTNFTRTQPQCLPEHWFHLLRAEPNTPKHPTRQLYTTRQRAEDAAALAHSKLQSLTNQIIHALELKTKGRLKFQYHTITRFQLTLNQNYNLYWKVLESVYEREIMPTIPDINLRLYKHFTHCYPPFFALFTKSNNEETVQTEILSHHKVTLRQLDLLLKIYQIT